MPDKRKVHRGLDLSTPHDKGEDVRVLQAQINKQFRHLKVDRRIAEDGEFGPATLSAARQVALTLGVVGKARKKLRAGRVSESTQRLIRGRKKTARESVATKARKRYRKKLRARYDVSGGKAALAEAKKRIGTTEHPDGSNWGGMVEEFIRYTGYTGPVYWCGCFACWCVVKVGGAKIPARIRLGYDGYIKADAASHSNGLVAVGFSEARAGDIVTYTFPHIEVVDHVSGDSIYTVGGNTSPQGGSGSQSNGGGVYAVSVAVQRSRVLRGPTTPERDHMKLSEYRKTVVAVIGAVVSICAIYGLEFDPALVAAVTTLATAGGVFWFANE